MRRDWTTLFFSASFVKKSTISTGPLATDGDRETNLNLLHTLEKQVAAHTHKTSYWGAFGLNPHLPATNLAQASITSAGTAALASPQSSLSSGSMLTLHNSKKVFSECNPAPSHTLSIYSHGPLLKLCSAPLPLPTPACKIIQILMDTLLPLIKGLCILMPLLPP